MAGDDEDPLEAGENLPDTVSYKQVSATVARRQKARDAAALEADTKRSRGQIPIPAQLGDIINKRRAKKQLQKIKPRGSDRSNRTGPDFCAMGGVQTKSQKRHEPSVRGRYSG